MSAFRKFIHADVKKGNFARLKYVGRVKRVTNTETKCIIRVLEAKPSHPIKVPEIRYRIKMEGPTGVELKKAGIIPPLMEGPTGLPVCEKKRRHAHIINRSHGKRRVQKTESRKIY